MPWPDPRAPMDPRARAQGNQGNNVPGNVLAGRGKIKAKSKVGDEHQISIEIWVQNQKGEISVQGQALVSLPSKSTPRERSWVSNPGFHSE